MISTYERADKGRYTGARLLARENVVEEDRGSEEKRIDRERKGEGCFLRRGDATEMPVAIRCNNRKRCSEIAVSQP